MNCYCGIHLSLWQPTVPFYKGGVVEAVDLHSYFLHFSIVSSACTTEFNNDICNCNEMASPACTCRIHRELLIDFLPSSHMHKQGQQSCHHYIHTRTLLGCTSHVSSLSNSRIPMVSMNSVMHWESLPT